MNITFKGGSFLFLLVGALLIVTLFTAPANWSPLYVALFLLLSPFVLLLNKRYGYILYSSLMTVSILLIILLINLLETPEYLWFMYFWFPLLWWPISAFVGRYAKTTLFASVASLSIILYYVVLNVYMQTSFPWALFPAFALLWWPLSLAFAKNYKLYSIISSVFIASFFVSLNAITTPEIAWAIYPIFVVLWWPVALYFSQKPFLFSMIAFSMLSIFFVCVNYITSPATIWAVYPIFIAIWWPLSLYFFSYKKDNQSVD
ncbi:hypothetical protein JCM19045_1784 [Bacillus sp. JCM 19045]|nr:hypothetical protein JCM19045_1784 [Bacillus sp. JCM 19045]